MIRSLSITRLLLLALLFSAAPAPAHKPPGRK
jgi:hypothetical protein